MADPTQAYYETQADEYFQATADGDLAPQWDTLASRLKPGAAILDLGSGSGRDLCHFARRGFYTAGLDRSLPLLRLSQAYTQRPSVQADLAAIPFRNQCFDAVWAMGSLLHLPPAALPHVLLDIHRVLKPGGFLFASLKRGTGNKVDGYGRQTFFHAVTPWTTMLCRCKFDVQTCEVTTEERRENSGEVRGIEWIETLARTNTK